MYRCKRDPGSELPPSQTQRLSRAVTGKPGRPTVFTPSGKGLTFKLSEMYSQDWKKKSPSQLKTVSHYPTSLLLGLCTLYIS